ncbi:hypothetical protein T4A_14311 [Trichinella pseudospiralis]|uniref:Uncharacterized protein n=1 Tax=Trichinella pseudospiralis TaxID=6337 RepID=A0A0V1EBP3_TRIPS|nr:hypothetical protein T4A_14311 [Trichinella pseudospiralis]
MQFRIIIGTVQIKTSLPFYYLNWYVVRCDSALQHHSTVNTSDLKKNKLYLSHVISTTLLL